jgi:DNA-binding NarL/FixJ family response regulator
VSVRTVVVAHREAMVAEGIASALSRYPEIVPVGVATSVAEASARAARADAVALDLSLPGAAEAAAELQRRGVRVVFLADGEAEEDEGMRVSTTSSVAALAAALVPGAGELRQTPHVLTTREREILTLVSQGMAGKQVARHLGISPKTVEHHKTRIFAKLRVPNQAAAVSFAMSDGLQRSSSWNLSSI